jgi:hypothetical protein
MFKALSIALALAIATPAAAQKAEPDFSLIDPAWAAKETDRSFQSGQSKVAWQALKRNFPDDYQAFVVEYANATLKHESLAPISGRFIQGHTVGVIDLARQAPAPKLARIQRSRAKLIQHLATSDLAACAVMAQGGDLQASVSRIADPLTLALFYENLSTFADAAGAGRDRPTSRTPLDARDVAKLKALIVKQGGSAQDADAIFSKDATIGDDAQSCRYGVMFYKAMAAAPDETAAKFAIK